MKSHPVIALIEHRMCAEAYRRLLEPEFKVSAIVRDARDLVATVAKLKARLIVMEILVPSLNGIEAIRKLRQADPRLKVVVLSAYSDPQYVREALQAGASAYVLKTEAPSELRKTLRGVLKGAVYPPSEVVRKPLRPRRAARPDIRQETLTERELEVLRLIAEGRTAKEIASRLKMSAKTAEFHRYRIMEKLNLRTVADLTKYAIRHGIVSLYEHL